MEAFNLLIEKYEYGGFFIIVGGIGENIYYQRLLKLKNTLTHGDYIIFWGEVPYSLISEFYRGAQVFFWGSIEETFGLPLVEAMDFGIPIVAGAPDLSPDIHAKCFIPTKEICGQSAEYFNPFNAEDACEALWRVIADNKHVDKLIRLGKQRSKLFTWEETAKQLLDLFYACNGDKRPEGEFLP